MLKVEILFGCLNFFSYICINMKEIKQVDRIKRFKLTCTLNDSGAERHFHHGHEYVEIGGIKWATCNVGAEKETDDGKYFAWGETKGFINASEKRFTWEDYKFGFDTSKYNETDGKTVLEPIDDAVASAWGNGWRMPTRDEFIVLGKATNSKWVTNYKGSGVNGFIFTDKEDLSKKLFIPACGYCGNGGVSNVGSFGIYWSSSLSSNVQYAYYLYFNDDLVGWQFDSSRYYGFPVRGVVE